MDKLGLAWAPAHLFSAIRGRSTSPHPSSTVYISIFNCILPWSLSHHRWTSARHYNNTHTHTHKPPWSLSYHRWTSATHYNNTHTHTTMSNNTLAAGINSKFTWMHNGEMIRKWFTSEQILCVRQQLPTHIFVRGKPTYEHCLQILGLDFQDGMQRRMLP